LDDNIIDTFRQVTGLFPFHAKQVYAAFLALNTPSVSSGYRESWLQAADESNSGLKNRISQLPFSDLTVFNRVLDSIPAETIVMLGNSSIIRYSQLFPAKEDTLYFSNRGVSGIDGYISTSAGIAMAAEKTTFILAGDLGFLYDSNGLWNDALPAGLRILVINNGGGGIFHILKGPRQQPGFKQFIEANHPVNIHKLAEAFGLRYFLAADDRAITDQWKDFLNGKGAAVFEVKTDAESSAAVFRQIMEAPR
jgi:2-succinyl-5-enolpyruvyl-6-hydroxy-3-cyclohexene-1-carboxylate synthase